MPKRKTEHRPTDKKPGQKLAHYEHEHTIHFGPDVGPKVDMYLATHTTSRGQSNRSALVRKAIMYFLKQDDDQWNLLFAMFNKQAKQLAAYTRRVELIVQILMHAQWFDFNLWPDSMSHEERLDSVRKANRMMANFEKSLKVKLEKGGYLPDISFDTFRDLIFENARALDLDALHDTDEADRSRAEQNHS